MGRARGLRPARKRILIGVIAALVVLAALAALRIAVNARCFAWQAPVVCHVETNDKRVALTFDDGPSRRGLEAVLPALEAHGASATFFLNGNEVERNPGLATQILDAGHEIGSHGFTHDRLLDLTGSRPARELETTDAALAAEGVPKPRWFRPPYGTKFLGLSGAVRDNDQTVVMWDVREPSAKDGPEAYARQVLEQVRPGSIILIHPMVSSRDVERAAVPLVLEGLAARGYEVVCVGELVDG